MESVIAHPTNQEQKDALTSFLRSLKVKYEITSDKAYDPEFVKKINESRQQAKDGKTVKISLDEIWPS
jgi:hypothetical protein